MNIGIILAIVVSIVMWVILKKTTFGYELKACGNNRDAAMYAGISAKKNVVLSMVISGALAGFGGGLFYLAGSILCSRPLKPLALTASPWRSWRTATPSAASSAPCS